MKPAVSGPSERDTTAQQIEFSGSFEQRHKQGPQPSTSSFPATGISKEPFVVVTIDRHVTNSAESTYLTKKIH
jgi:hypothetical protein